MYMCIYIFTYTKVPVAGPARQLRALALRAGGRWRRGRGRCGLEPHRLPGLGSLQSREPG